MVGVGPSVDSVSTLDCSNILHLQNSDFNVTNVISIKLSGTENYRVWAAAMRLAINTRNKTGFIDGTCLKETYASSAVYSSQWDRCNSIVLSWLLNSVSDDLYLGQIFSENASEVWSELKETYDKLDGSVTLNLLNKIHNFKQGELTVSEYYHKLIALGENMISWTKLPNAHRGIIEGHCLSTSSGSLAMLKYTTCVLFLLLSIGPIMCTNYEKTGHTADRCFDLIGYPPGYNRNPAPRPNNFRPYSANNASPLENGATLSFTNEQMMKLMNLINDVPLEGNTGKYTKLIWRVLRWIIDSGANQHMTISTINMFGIVDVSDLSLTVARSLKKNGKNINPKDKDLVHSQIVGTGSENGGLYLFDYDSPKFSICSNIGNMSVVCYVSKSLWHSRLGHPSDQALDVLQGNLRFTKNSSKSPCDICHKGGDTHPDHSDGQDEGDAASMGDNSYFEGNVPSSSNVDTIRGEPENSSQVQPDLRRSSRTSKQPARFNDFVVGSSKLYGRKPVGSKWLWKIKFKSTGEIERYKSRVVAKGYSQREGFDYSETFSPVVKMSTVRCMLNVAICNGWDLFQLDVNNAFLYGDLMRSSQAMECQDDLTLVENGFVQSKYDYSLFTKTSGDMVLMLLVYVDDIVITGNDNSEIGKFKEMLKSKFQIKDLGNLKYFLGIEVIDNDDGVCLSQRKYCLEVLHEYGLLAGRPGFTRKLLHAPLSSHLEAAFRVLRYLKNSPGSGIQINKVGNLKLRAYADSDWARCPATRKSVSGYCVFLGSSLITWKSKKQSTLSRSSAEAEYRSMASATCEVIWLSNLLGDMGVKNLLPVVLYCDNSSALQIAANPVFHEKSKHFEIDVHLVREKVASGVIVTEKIHTSQQIADVLTKALGSKQHDELCTKIGILDMFKVPQVDKT
ncbi:putative RNA-directed DNA polymerase [Tanacetum coccineum]